MNISSYMKEIGMEKNLSPEREKELALLIQAGDVNALHELTRANLRFVISVAKKFQGQGIDLEDLISEGNIGLMKAAYRFDPSKNVKFLSYAVWWIRQAIMEALTLDNRTIRLPVNRIVDREALRKAEMVLEQQFGRPPTQEELIEYLESDDANVTYAYVVNKDMLHLDNKTILNGSSDAFSSSSEMNTWMDIIENPNTDVPDEYLKTEDISNRVCDLLDTLPEREADIIRMTFGIGHDCEYSTEDIGHILGVSRQRISQIIKKAMTALQEAACVV